MSILNPASILSAASGLGKAVGKSSPALGQYAPYAGIAAQAVGKFAEALPGMVGKAESFLGNLEQGVSKLGGSSAVQMGLYLQANTGSASTQSAVNLATQWDSNKDGVLSKDELQTGLQQLSGQITQQQTRVNNSKGNALNSVMDQLKLKELTGMQTLGQKMLAGFDNIAAMDGQAGISVNDLKTMASQDKNPYVISAQEFSRVTQSAGASALATV